MKIFPKKFIFVFTLLIAFALLFSCAPISNEADAENFANAMIKGYFVGDSSNKIFSESNKSKSLTQSSASISNFTSSHFYSDLSNDFTFDKFVYSNSEITYENSTYIVSGNLYWAVDFQYNNGLNLILIAYGDLQVIKDGQTQNVKFDTKYTFSLNLSDSNNDGVYDINISGNFNAYVNDINVKIDSWSISFSGKLFGFSI